MKAKEKKIRLNNSNLELMFFSMFYVAFLALRKYEYADLLLIGSFLPYCLYKMNESRVKRFYLPLIELGMIACLVVITLFLMSNTRGQLFEILIFFVIWVLLTFYRPIYKSHHLHQ